MPIGAQMYTLRDHCKTPDDIASSCKRVKAMGYDTIQASASGFNTIDPLTLKRILDDQGLSCAATHENLLSMDAEQVKAVIQKHQILGCQWTAIGGFHPKDKWTIAGWREFIDKFNGLAKLFAGSGVSIGYHNHSHEFARLPGSGDGGDTGVAGGTIAMQMLLDELDPSIWIEIDTYWVQHGGGDPAAWIEKCKGRIPCVHIKDMTIGPDRQHKMCEVGVGNLNWPRILQACSAAGVKHYLIERDTGDLDPFDSLQISVRNLRSMGVK